MHDIEEIIDTTGEVRRLGSLMPPENMVSAFPPFAGDAEHPVWSESDIRRVLRSTGRKPARQTFGTQWIQNQRSHGSCNGYGWAAAYARARWMKGIQDGKLFSGAYAYSLMNGGQDRGSILEDGMRNAQERGICLESTVAWNQIYPHQFDKAKADAEAANYKALNCYHCRTKEAWDTGLATGLFFGIAAVHAGNNFQRLNGQGIAGVDNGSGNHAVCIDDIVEINGTLVYDMANSWGTAYGQQGRAYLTWDSFVQTFQRHVFYLIPITQEGR